MNRRSQFTILLILLLVASTFVALPHYHTNTADDHDCPICVVSLHQPAAGPLSPVVDGVPCLVATVSAAVSPVFAEKLLSCSLNNRAPPA